MTFYNQFDIFILFWPRVLTLGQGRSVIYELYAIALLIIFKFLYL